MLIAMMTMAINPIDKVITTPIIGKSTNTTTAVTIAAERIAYFHLSLTPFVILAQAQG